MNILRPMLIRQGLLLILMVIGIAQLASGVGIYLKAWLAQELIEQAWDQNKGSEHDGSRVKPWPWADTYPIAELEVPRLNIEQFVLAGDSGRVLAFGPGLNEASASIGEPGLSLISAHRDTHFKFLKSLQEGDKILITTARKELEFRVVEMGVVNQLSFQPLVEADESLLMLVTCYPFDAMQSGGDLRFIVVAYLVNDNSENGA